MTTENQPREEKPASFQEQLRAQCAEWWTNYEAATAGNKLVAMDWRQILYDFVKEVALVSFKNGVTVGKRKSGDGRQQNDPHRSAHPNA